MQPFTLNPCVCIALTHDHHPKECERIGVIKGGICNECRLWTYFHTERPRKVYIAGPMTGIPQFNFPAFDALAATLRQRGWEVHSPAEMDDPATRAAALTSPDGAPGSGSANGETWGTFLSRDVLLIADSGLDAIVVLPGWWTSRGARLETFVGFLCKIDILDSADNMKEVSLLKLIMAWAGLNLLQLRRLVQNGR